MEETLETGQDTIQNVTTLSDDELQGLLEEPQEDTPEPEQDGGETDTDPAGNEGEPPAEEDAEETVETLKEKLARLEKNRDDKESFVQKQANEIGALRAEMAKLQSLVRPMSEAERTALNDQFLTDPIGAQESYTKRQREQEALEMQIQSLRKTANQQTVLRYHADFETKKSGIAEYLAERGISQDGVNDLLTNPYSFDPDILIALTDAVKEREQVKALRAENERLKGRAGTVLKRVAKATARPAAKALPTIDEDENIGSLTPGQLAAMSDEELFALEKKLR